MKYCSFCEKWFKGQLEKCPICNNPLNDGVSETRGSNVEKREDKIISEKTSNTASNSNVIETDLKDVIKKELKKERQKRRSNVQGCGCLLILFGCFLFLTIVGSAFSSVFVFVGIVVLIVGFFI